jgi:DNA-binding transcriptional LysR family regulator
VLDVRRMRVLREVAARGSIAAAAAALDFTPSAVSQQIAALEREAQIALVDRGPRSVVLTAAGEALVEHADVLLAGLAAAEAELRAIAGLRGGRVRLGLFATATALVAQALRAFRVSHPEVGVTLSEIEPEASLALLRRGELDAAIVFAYDFAPLDAGRAVEIHELMRDPLLIALPAAHPLAHRRHIALRELATERWIMERPGTVCYRLTHWACEPAGFQPRVELIDSDNYRIVQALVAAGIGAAFVPALAREPTPDLAFAHSDPPITRMIGFACRAGGRRSPAVAAMLAVLADTATQIAAQPRRGGTL